MADTKTIGITALLTLIVSGLIGGTLYSVYETGNELTCRTNKPVGWEVDEVLNVGGLEVYKAHCPYTTQDWLYADCLSFRETSSYQRYGCQEVVVVKEETPAEKPQQTIGVWGKQYECPPGGAPCFEK